MDGRAVIFIQNDTGGTGRGRRGVRAEPAAARAL